MFREIFLFHYMNDSIINISTDKTKKYCCEFCEYYTCKHSDYKKHLNTDKHKKREYETKFSPNSQKSLGFECINCGGCFNSRTTLWRHKNKCNNQNKDTMTDKDVIMLLIKENSELKNMIMKVLENGTNTTTTMSNSNNSIANNINNNNKTFNLQFFLNETCKNAMNITDFIESLQPQLSDLESIGKLGFVEGISKIIIKGLKALDETERPIHCTDKKRETVYVKDEDKWEKEDDNKTRLRKAINDIAHENILLLPQWKAKHPDYLDSSSLDSDKYNNMVIEVLGGDDDSNVNEDKIIRKIAKEVVIDKT